MQQVKSSKLCISSAKLGKKNGTNKFFDDLLIPFDDLNNTIFTIILLFNKI